MLSCHDPKLEITLTSCRARTKHAYDHEPFTITADRVRPKNLKRVRKLSAYHLLHGLREGSDSPGRCSRLPTKLFSVWFPSIDFRLPIALGISYQRLDSRGH